MLIRASLIACVAMVAITSAQSPRRTLHVCHAGSLTAAFTEVERSFAREHTTIAVSDTAGGSVDLARRFAAGEIECDVFAPADYLVIERLLEPAHLADFAIRFAHGRTVIAYLSTDPKAAALAEMISRPDDAKAARVSGRWYEALLVPGVRIGGAHPFLDPGGYRAHMIFELAQARYNVAGLANALLRHYQVNPADATGPVPTLGKDFNFQFTYEHSAAAATKMDATYRYALLPPEIDLSSEDVGSYRNVGITIPGLGIGSATASVTIPATRTEWGITIASGTRDREAAIAFVSSVLGEPGHIALITNGPAPMTPARVASREYEELPSTLRALVVKP